MRVHCVQPRCGSGIQPFHHYVVLVTTAKRCVNALAERGQSPLHRGGFGVVRIRIVGRGLRAVEGASPYRGGLQDDGAAPCFLRHTMTLTAFASS